MLRIGIQVAIAVLVVGAVAASGAGTPAAATGGTGSAAAAADGPSLGVRVAPGDALSTLRSADSAAAFSGARLTPRLQVTPSDALVIDLRAEGLGDAVASQPGNDTTDRLFSLLADDRASLTGVQYRPTSDATPKALDLTDPEAVTAVRGSGDAVHLVIDPAALSAERDDNGNGRADDGSTGPVQPGEVYTLSFAFDGQSVERSIGIYEATASFAPERRGQIPQLVPAAGQEIRAETTLAPGTEVTIELTATGDDVTFSRSRDVRVQNRSFGLVNATFDLSGIPGSTPVSVLVTSGERVLGAARTTVADYEARLSVPRESDHRDRLPVGNLSLSDPGFLIVQAGSAEGPVVANRHFEAGTYTDVSVSFTREVAANHLVVSVVADVDGDAVYDRGGPDRLFARDGKPVAAVVRLPGATGTPTPGGVRGTDAGGSPGRYGNNSSTFTPYTISDVEGPGFGPVAAAVALLGAVALLARRSAP